MNQAQTLDKEFISRLKAGGERVTAPRITIFRLLSRHSPLPMRKLTERARADGVDTVTVYRTVALFQRLGLMREIGVGSHRLLELTDDFGEHHHHFWCGRCGRITDFDNPDLERSIQEAAGKLGITVDTHQLELTGTCADCGVQ